MLFPFQKKTTKAQKQMLITKIGQRGSMTKKYQKDWKEMELNEIATSTPTHTHKVA